MVHSPVRAVSDKCVTAGKWMPLSRASVVKHPRIVNVSSFAQVNVAGVRHLGEAEDEELELLEEEAEDEAEDAAHAVSKAMIALSSASVPLRAPLPFTLGGRSPFTDKCCKHGREKSRKRIASGFELGPVRSWSCRSSRRVQWANAASNAQGTVVSTTRRNWGHSTGR